ncbi:MAG: hypothetical protein A2741_00045 [Candidatus Zambryskibacteria bacterium RIFCSPHIGHO2_01_FULL_43_27]|nr:MAG: hypothetical protein A2741_00045 [Candidatus Zambryskibacteria bacterium RIFCSPHIGHO2_01_FULL_43_27]
MISYREKTNTAVESLKYISERMYTSYIQKEVSLSIKNLTVASYHTINFEDAAYFPLMRFMRRQGAKTTDMEIRIKDDSNQEITALDLEDNIMSLIGNEKKLLILYTDGYVPLEMKVRISQVYETNGITILLLKKQDVPRLFDLAQIFSIDGCIGRLCDLAKGIMVRRVVKKPFDSTLADMSKKDWRLHRIATQQARTIEKKSKFLHAYQKTMGNITAACYYAGIKSTKTFYNWCETDRDFKEAADTTLEMRKDYVQDLLMAQIAKGKGTFIRYFLKTCHPSYMGKRTTVPPKNEPDQWKKWENMPWSEDEDKDGDEAEEEEKEEKKDDDENEENV